MKLSAKDREAIRQLTKRMDLCWLEMAEVELREAHLAELTAIYEELLQILDRYDVEAAPDA
jgi:hypothetical protein